MNVLKYMGHLYCGRGLLCIAFACSFSINTFAHRVNVFAEYNYGIINIDCYYSKGEKVHSGRIKILTATKNELVYEGITDNNGFLSLRLPENVITNKSGIKIILDAGMGHRAQWNMEYNDILTSRDSSKKSSFINLEGVRVNNFTKANAIENSTIPSYKIILGVAILIAVFSIAYFLTKQRRSSIS